MPKNLPNRGILALQGYGCSKDKPQAAHDDIAVWERN